MNVQIRHGLVIDPEKMTDDERKHFNQLIGKLTDYGLDYGLDVIQDFYAKNGWMCFPTSENECCNSWSCRYPYFVSTSTRKTCTGEVVYEEPVSSAILINKSSEPEEVNISIENRTDDDRSEYIEYFNTFKELCKEKIKKEHSDCEESEFYELIFHILNEIQSKYEKYFVTGKWILIYYS